MPTETYTAIIAATSALAGVLIAQVGTWLHAASDRRDKRRALLLGKLEELADNLHLTLRWADQVMARLDSRSPPAQAGAGTPTVPLSDETRRVYVLSLLYFPELRTESQRFLRASMVMYMIANDWQARDDDTLAAAAHDFAEARRTIDDAITGLAERLI